jgi:pimeloyl-ACP methyl ester carboxylesterase
MHCREALVYTQSEDGLLLTGIRIVPDLGTSHATGIIWIHGNTGTFYDWPYITIGRVLAKHGYPFLSGNTRGHDIAATLYRLPQDNPVAGGSAWEQLEEAPADLAAWVTLAVEAGARQVVLVGHSQGATKVVAYQGQRADPRVAGIILASPEQYGHWDDSLATAQDLVAVNRPFELLTLFPEEPWYQLSAQNIVSRARLLEQAYATTERTPYLAKIISPILALYGSDGDVGGEKELEVLRHTARDAARMDTEVVAGADHVYTGCEEQIARLIADWISLAV